MKIAIDVQTTLGQPTGFGFYVSNLARELERLDGKHHFELIRPKKTEDFSTPQRWWWDQVTFPKIAMERGADLLHQPCFSAPFRFRGPVVITIHDIISILYPANIPLASRMFYSKWMPYSYRCAAKIITISQSTMNDITRVLHIPQEKITVIPLAVDDRFQKVAKQDEVERAKRKYRIPGGYILHIGTLEPRKNLGVLIDVFSQVIREKEIGNLYLVICGKKGWYYEGLFEKVKKLNLEKRVIFTGYIEDKDKPALYKGAEVFAFPSLYEGFGLPPLEAMASGVPVVSSNTSSMPEVVGEAGILLPPTDKKRWVEALLRVCQDHDLRRKMISKNRDQVKKFSWGKTARETVRVYENAVKTNSKVKCQKSKL